jgi:hypothetical protein
VLSLTRTLGRGSWDTPSVPEAFSLISIRKRLSRRFWTWRKKYSPAAIRLEATGLLAPKVEATQILKALNVSLRTFEQVV